ncbi:sulfur transferase domain-containing protein [uncultured Stenotrophomonas sp.]|uniref:fused DSP-PTPase phosphatase/NAD kinase-like protein n=1 Tax=uncultured Stenotrophomonas sp. TaxID=165438 RepID=UPI0025F6A2BA|nr:sulfur transferase domain-containing protein [uncultured Stenotrophomonas sp.]
MYTYRLSLLLSLLLAANAYAGDATLRQPRPDLITAGQPSAQQLRDAAANGVTTVIDLRRADEDRGYDEAALAEQLGLRYVRLPIAGAGDITDANARTLDRLLKQDSGKTLLHCASSNRAGALLSVIEARVNGAAMDDALKFGRDAGMTSLEPAARAALETPTP